MQSECTPAVLPQEMYLELLPYSSELKGMLDAGSYNPLRRLKVPLRLKIRRVIRHITQDLWPLANIASDTFVLIPQGFGLGTDLRWTTASSDRVSAIYSRLGLGSVGLPDGRLAKARLSYYFQQLPSLPAPGGGGGPLLGFAASMGPSSSLWASPSRSVTTSTTNSMAVARPLEEAPVSHIPFRPSQQESSRTSPLVVDEVPAAAPAQTWLLPYGDLDDSAFFLPSFAPAQSAFPPLTGTYAPQASRPLLPPPPPPPPPPPRRPSVVLSNEQAAPSTVAGPPLPNVRRVSVTRTLRALAPLASSAVPEPVDPAAAAEDEQLAALADAIERELESGQGPREVVRPDVAAATSSSRRRRRSVVSASVPGHVPAVSSSSSTLATAQRGQVLPPAKRRTTATVPRHITSAAAQARVEPRTPYAVLAHTLGVESLSPFGIS